MYVKNVVFIVYTSRSKQNDYCKYNYVIMGAMASQMTSLTIYLTVYSGADQRKHQRSALVAFVRGIHRWPANSPHKWPVTRKMFPFDDVIMVLQTTFSDAFAGAITFVLGHWFHCHQSVFSRPMDSASVLVQMQAQTFIFQTVSHASFTYISYSLQKTMTNV